MGNPKCQKIVPRQTCYVHPPIFFGGNFISTNSGSWKLNIAHLGLTNVDVGDLLVMPLQALPSVDPLPVDPFLVDPLPIDDFYNDSFHIDLLPADLDQAFMLPNNV